MYKQKYKHTQRIKAMGEIEGLQTLKEELKNLEPTDWTEMEEKLTSLKEKPAEEKSFAETYWEYMFKGIEKTLNTININDDNSSC